MEKSDERVALAALSLMNALHDKSDAPSREQIVKVGIMTAVFFFIEHIWQKWSEASFFFCKFLRAKLAVEVCVSFVTAIKFFVQCKYSYNNP